MGLTQNGRHGYISSRYSRTVKNLKPEAEDFKYLRKICNWYIYQDGYTEVGYKISNKGKIPVLKKGSNFFTFRWDDRDPPEAARSKNDPAKFLYLPYGWRKVSIGSNNKIIRTNYKNNNKLFTKINGIPANCGNYYQRNGKILGRWSRKFYKKNKNGTFIPINKSEINKLKTTGGCPIGVSNNGNLTTKKGTPVTNTNGVFTTGRIHTAYNGPFKNGAIVRHGVRLAKVINYKEVENGLKYVVIKYDNNGTNTMVNSRELKVKNNKGNFVNAPNGGYTRVVS
jgi:hypothetical protein